MFRECPEIGQKIQKLDNAIRSFEKIEDVNWNKLKKMQGLSKIT